MEETVSVTSALRDIVAKAFFGVVLGRGVSIRQSQVIDRYGEGVSDREFELIPLQEITDDWSRIPFAELEAICVPHLDAEGYRYYIPALTLSVLDKYEASSMRVIGAIGSLYPKNEMWSYHMGQYELLNQQQLKALAIYVNALPTLVPLTGEDRVMIPRAMRNYWGQFLPQ